MSKTYSIKTEDPLGNTIVCTEERWNHHILNDSEHTIMKGNEIQMNDVTFKNELLSWMRFNNRQVESTHDGLSYLVFGNPPLPKRLARPIVSLFTET